MPLGRARKFLGTRNSSALQWTKDPICGVFIDWGWVQMGECLLHLHRALGWIPSPAYTRREWLKFVIPAGISRDRRVRALIACKSLSAPSRVELLDVKWKLFSLYRIKLHTHKHIYM